MLEEGLQPVEACRACVLLVMLFLIGQQHSDNNVCCGGALQGVSTEHLLDGDTPVIGTSENFTQPGIYTLEVPCPRTRSTATIHLEMWDENKITFVDDFSLSFHMHFEKLLKWLVALPFTLAAIVLIALKSNSASHALPSFSRTDGLLLEP